MLAVSDLGCIRGESLLFNNLNFELKGGGLLYVQGPNGSGKSSLLRVISGLLRPEQGRVTWNGGDIDAHADSFRQQLLYIGHLNALKDELTPAENLLVAAGLCKQAGDTAQIAAALAAVGLQSHAEQPVGQLSQGQQRRVALARLWLGRSRLWLLDEPYAALDHAAQQTLARRVERHLAADGMAVVVTHQRVEIAAAAVQEVRLAA